MGVNPLLASDSVRCARVIELVLAQYRTKQMDGVLGRLTLALGSQAPIVRIEGIFRPYRTRWITSLTSRPR